MIPEVLARVLAKVPADLMYEIVALIQRALAAPDPRAAVARAAQVLAHEKAADAAVEGMFAAKSKLPGTGE